MQGTDEIFEFRVDNNGKFYRLFAFWDNQGSSHTLIVATSGLLKKSNKTPKSEIVKAENIKNKYFNK